MILHDAAFYRVRAQAIADEFRNSVPEYIGRERDARRERGRVVRSAEPLSTVSNRTGGAWLWLLSNALADVVEAATTKDELMMRLAHVRAHLILLEWEAAKYAPAAAAARRGRPALLEQLRALHRAGLLLEVERDE